MSGRRKPWIHRTEQQATCDRCGGVSVWRPCRIGYGREIGKWRWWRRFKQTHSRCVER